MFDRMRLGSVEVGRTDERLAWDVAVEGAYAESKSYMQVLQE
jgi:hypothetical protein